MSLKRRDPLLIESDGVEVPGTGEWRPMCWR
jgi:hypothetical protein